MPRRRGRIEIMLQILQEAIVDSPKTRIMWRNNLSLSSFNDHIQYLLKKGLIAEVPIKGRTLYKTTDKGREFLEAGKELKKYIDLVE